MMNGNYKIKAEIVFESVNKGTAQDVKMFFVCDPQKNTECKKQSCGICKHTSNIAFAKRFDVCE